MVDQIKFVFEVVVLRNTYLIMNVEALGCSAFTRCR